MAGLGRKFKLHGLFKFKWRAVEKEEDTPGSFILELLVRKGKNRGQKRYLVVTKRTL